MRFAITKRLIAIKHKRWFFILSSWEWIPAFARMTQIELSMWNWGYNNSIGWVVLDRKVTKVMGGGG